MRTTLELFGSGTPAKAVQLSPQRLINLYPVESFGSSGEKSRALYKTPGTSLWATIPNLGTIRGWLEVKGALYIVSDNMFYVVSASKTFTNIGTLVTTNGRVSIDTDGSVIQIDDGSKGYTYTISTNTFAQISNANYIPSGFISIQAGRTIYSVPDTNVVKYSDLGTLSAYQTTSFFSAESIKSNLICAYGAKNGFDLYLIGREATEAWAITGDANGPYSKRVGVNIPYGIESRWTLQEVDGAMIWLARNDQGKRLLISVENFQPKLLLDEHDLYELNTLTDGENAYAFTFQLNGHIFYSLHFPADKRSYLFDIQTKQLVRWASWQQIGTLSNGDPVYELGRHLSTDFVSFSNKLLISDYRGSGRILELSDSTYTDYSCGPDDSIYFEVIGSILHQEKRRISLHSIIIDMEVGESDVSELELTDAENLPLINISLSKNGGKTFSYTRTANFGYTGEYNKLVKLNKWGQFRDGSIKIFGNHSSFIAMFKAIIDITIEGIANEQSRG